LDGETSHLTFEELETEGGADKGAEQKLEARITNALTVLKGKLKPEEYAECAKLFGIKADLTNLELLAAVEKLVKPCATTPEEEEKKKTEMAGDYKGFMQSCMKGGKDLKTCADEWKKKYPEPAKAMEADFAKLDGEIQAALDKEKLAAQNVAEKDKKIDTLEKMVTSLTETVNKLSNKEDEKAVKFEVDQLVANKNISPAQAETILKLSVPMKPEERKGFLEVFRKQKLTVTDDKGALEKHEELDPDKKKKILERSGLSDLIGERGSSAAKKQLLEHN
jgi:uncharacterized protein YoxC